MSQFYPSDASLLKWNARTRSLYLRLPDPFSYEQNFGYLSRSSNECLFYVDNSSIYKLLQIMDQQVLIHVDREDNRMLRIQLIHMEGQNSADPNPALLDAVTRYVSEWFDLGRDLAPFYALAERDPLLSRVAKNFYGLRLMGIPDLFEALSWGIIGQQINLTFAYTLKRRLVEAFGSDLEWEGRTYWTFPAPERVAALRPSDLTALQFTGKKAEYVIGVAKMMAEGELTKASLLALEDIQLIEKELVRIRGIGPWTANYVLMRCLRNQEAFPIADVGLHNALKQVLGLNEKPSLPTIRELAREWAGWEAYAAFYLWRVLY